jgi:hypothetical protein
MHSSIRRCASLRILDERGDATLLVELELELGRVELERTAAAARAQERLVHAVQRQQPVAHGLEPGRMTSRGLLQELADIAVREPCAERITPSKKRERVMRPSSATRSSQHRQRRSSSGLSEHRPFDSASGSIGITRFGK